MKKMKRLAFVVVMVMLASILFACAPAEAPQDGNTPEDAAQGSVAVEAEDTNGDGIIKIGVPVFNLGHTYWVSWVDEIEKLAGEKGFEVISADSKFDAAKQVNLMEDMIAQGCDAIILCPVDPGGVGVVIKEAEAAGVRVIPVSYTHLDVYKRQIRDAGLLRAHRDQRRSARKAADTYTGRA